MYQRLGQPIYFAAQFTAGGVPADPSNGTVLVSVDRIDADGTIDEQVTDANASGIALGLASYVHANTALPGTYVARFRTTAGAPEIDNPVMFADQSWVVGADWFELLWIKLPQIAALGVENIPNVPAPFSAQLAAETDVRFSQSVSITGYPVGAWTGAAFTIKRSTDDDDSEALLTLRVSNPASVGTDGIVWHRGRGVAGGDALRTAGVLAVAQTAPALIYDVHISALGMDLPPCKANEKFAYEFNLFQNGDKEQTAKGSIVISQSVRRAIVLP
jgi:hypothetical protein